MRFTSLAAAIKHGFREIFSESDLPSNTNTWRDDFTVQERLEYFKTGLKDAEIKKECYVVC